MKKMFPVLTAAAIVVATACQSMAAALVDYSAIGTSVTAELTPALLAVVPIAGTLLAIGVGWKFVRRFVK